MSEAQTAAVAEDNVNASKLTPKEKIKNFKDNNPKAFVSILIAVFLLLLIIIFSGGDSSGDYNPYTEDAQAPAAENGDTVNDTEDPMGDMSDPMGDMGDPMGDMGTDNSNTPTTGGGMVHVSNQKQEPAVDIMDEPTPLPKPKSSVMPKPAPKRATPSVEQLAAAYQPRMMSNDKQINNLLTELDNLVYTTLSQFDLSKIRADALKGTSTQQEVLNQIGKLMDTATLLQKKRSALIDATNDVNNSKLNPKAVVKQQLAPVQMAINNIEKKIAEFSRSMDALSVKVAEKPKQTTLYGGFNDTPVVQKHSTIPSLTMLLVDDGFTAQFSVDGTPIKRTAIGQEVGGMKIIKVYSDGVLLDDGNDKKYIATLEGTVEVGAGQ